MFARLVRGAFDRLPCSFQNISPPNGGIRMGGSLRMRQTQRIGQFGYPCRSMPGDLVDPRFISPTLGNCRRKFLPRFVEICFDIVR